MIVAQIWEYVKHHKIVSFKWANFLACELYLNKPILKSVLFKVCQRNLNEDLNA